MRGHLYTTVLDFRQYPPFGQWISEPAFAFGNVPTLVLKTETYYCNY